MQTAILALMTRSRADSPEPVTERPRIAAIKRHVAFESLATWLAAFVAKPPAGDHRRIVAIDDLEPPVRDRIIEEAVRAASVLDPIVEKVARHRARLLVANMVAQLQRDLVEADGPYSPENCRWATTFEQRHNRSVSSSLDLTNRIH